jgi:aerobic C4-dicarboxylate transport protein
MTTLCLLVVGLVIEPGTGIKVAPHGTAELQLYLKSASTNFSDFLLTRVPDNAVAAFAKGELLQVLIFAVLFGAGLSAPGELSDVLFRVIAIIMRLAPLGAFDTMAFTRRMTCKNGNPAFALFFGRSGGVELQPRCPAAAYRATAAQSANS